MGLNGSAVRWTSPAHARFFCWLRWYGSLELREHRAPNFPLVTSFLRMDELGRLEGDRGSLEGEATELVMEEERELEGII